MKLFVLSDSHGAVGMLELAAQHIEENRYDTLVHLGDFRSDADWLEKRLNRNVISVAGNCDLFDSGDRETVFRAGQFRILATHGHKQGVKTELSRLSYYAEEQLCDVALFGHTHESFTGYVGKTLLVNPGTLLNGRAAEITIEGNRIDPRIIRI